MWWVSKLQLRLYVLVHQSACHFFPLMYGMTIKFVRAYAFSVLNEYKLFVHLHQSEQLLCGVCFINEM